MVLEERDDLGPFGRSAGPATRSRAPYAEQWLALVAEVAGAVDDVLLIDQADPIPLHIRDECALAAFAHVIPDEKDTPAGLCACSNVGEDAVEPLKCSIVRRPCEKPPQRHAINACI